jgi:hypothetical protein
MKGHAYPSKNEAPKRKITDCGRRRQRCLVSTFDCYAVVGLRGLTHST